MNEGDLNRELSSSSEKGTDLSTSGTVEGTPAEEPSPVSETTPKGAADDVHAPAAGGQPAPNAVPPAPGVPYAIPGGGASGWFRRHRVLVGILAGILSLALLGGMFALGYAVGKPDQTKPAPAADGLNRPWRETRPFRSYPRPRERMEDRVQGLDILREARDELLELVASELGMSTGELEDRLEEGESIADLAEERGVSTEELVDKMASRIGEIADRLVSEGTLTESQAEAVKSHAEAVASLFVHGGLRAFRGPFRR